MKSQRIDRWALMKSEKLLRRVTQAYREYEFHTVFHSIHNFCTVDISNIYFDVQKTTCTAVTLMNSKEGQLRRLCTK